MAIEKKTAKMMNLSVGLTKLQNSDRFLFSYFHAVFITA